MYIKKQLKRLLKKSENASSTLCDFTVFYSCCYLQELSVLWTRSVVSLNKTSLKRVQSYVYLPFLKLKHRKYVNILNQKRIWQKKILDLLKLTVTTTLATLLNVLHGCQMYKICSILAKNLCYTKTNALVTV